jgi:hypothetical protein
MIIFICANQFSFGQEFKVRGRREVIPLTPPPSYNYANQAVPRTDEGAPLTSAELAKATDELIDIIKRTNYFDFADSRIQGWPASDSKHKYWWGSYWSGITVTKNNGVVTYKHSNDGSDNNGMRTAPYLEGACYAYSLWHNPREARIVRKSVRGFSSRILQSERISQPNMPKVISRVLYPENVDVNEDGRQIHIDYSANRPGVRVGVIQYVHIPDNPTFGDIWIKNSHSRDDLGEMMRSMALIRGCEGQISRDVDSDIFEMRNLFSEWATDVDQNNFEIPSLDEQGNYNKSTDSGTDKFNHRVLLCWGNYALRLLHLDYAENLDCGDADFKFEDTFHRWIQNDALQQQRTMRIAAVAMAHQKKQNVNPLIDGIVKKIVRDLKYIDGSWSNSKVNINDIPGFFINANNVGAPLTSKEIRWLHERLHRAYLEIDGASPVFHVFDTSTPSGTYSYEAPGNTGINFSTIGLLLGACASPYRNLNNRQVFDCQRLQARMLQ